MENFAANVAKFNDEILGVRRGPKTLLTPEALKLRVDHLKEEVKELVQSHIDGDIIGAIDAYIDLMYLAAGGLYWMGLTPAEISKCAEAVHNCNMTRKKGQNSNRNNGVVPDAVKPADWIGPEERIAIIIGGLT
jgi:predicted HAD superfamily Cof-like phosphohydrolase